MEEGGLRLPTVEVLHDSYADACETFLVLDERHHVLAANWPWFRWCQSIAKGSKLLVYKHLETGRFMLCAWVYGPWETDRPIVMELEGFSASPQEIWPADLLCPALMLYRLGPIDEAIERRIANRREQEYEARASREDALRSRNDFSRHLRRKGAPGISAMLDSGMLSPSTVPSRKTSSDEEAMKKELTESLTKSLSR